MRILLRSATPYALSLLLALGVSYAVWAQYRANLDTCLWHYRTELHARALAAAQQMDSGFQQMYQGLRTIARLPGVRQIDPHQSFHLDDGRNRAFSGDARRTVQEIYNNLATNVAMSEVYIVPKDMDPDKKDPNTGKLQIPITTFDRLIVGRNADQFHAEADAEDSGAHMPEIEIFEYRLMKKQLAWMKQQVPTERQIAGLESPAISGPEVITCDNSRYSPARPNDKDRSGLVYSVPFFGPDGRLKGCISGIILTHALRDRLSSSRFVLCNSRQDYAAPPNGAGAWLGAGPWLARAVPDPRLLYSETLPLHVNDQNGKWALWAGQADSEFAGRTDVKAARLFLELGELAAAALLAGLWALLGLMGRHRAVVERKNQDLERRVEERTAELRAATEKMAALATTDPLTALPNHRAMMTALDHEMERVHRFQRPCGVLFVDIDHFKALNDSCGHGVGDAALQEFGAVVRRCLRGIDTLGRWGGEEFIVLLPETDEAKAMAVAERVRAAVASHLFLACGGGHLTCSLGVAVWPRDGLDRARLVEAADRAMYGAKRLGRNQVRSRADPSVAALTEGGGSREEQVLQGEVEALAGLVAARDQYTGQHTQEVAALTVRLALALGRDISEARLIGLVGQLHDVGKVAVPDSILQKPARLTDEEWVIMRRHPVVGADVISRLPSLRVIAPAIRSHHERWDGRGYPDGLAGEAIPLGARIVAVADAFGAMTSDRPYQQARSVACAVEEIERGSGSQFDPSVVQALQAALGVRAAPGFIPA